MQTFFKDYLNNLEELHHGVESTVEEMPQTALDWTPDGSGFYSISVLIVHLTGAERYWLGEVVAREPSGRDRDAEFKVREVSLDVLKNRLADSLVYAHQVLGWLTLPDLETSRISP